MIPLSELWQAPCLFYPVGRQLGYSVGELLGDGNRQLRVFQEIAARYPVDAVVRMTELWCEAASFGMACDFPAGDFPRLGAPVCAEAEELAALCAPEVVNPVTAPLIEGVRLAAGRLDRPLIVGVTGPYTLGSVLLGSEEFMVAAMTEPECVHAFLETATGFLAGYLAAYRQAGAAGAMICEPSTAMISPAMMDEFSNRYLERLVEAVQDERFSLIYHNCGAVNGHLAAIGRLGTAGFHFGAEVDLARALDNTGAGARVMGNVDPRLMRSGRPAQVEQAVLQLIQAHGAQSRWALSTGCDLAPGVPDENLAAFFRAASARKTF